MAAYNAQNVASASLCAGLQTIRSDNHAALLNPVVTPVPELAPPMQRWLYWTSAAPVPTLESVNQVGTQLTWWQFGDGRPNDVEGQVKATGLPAGVGLDVMFVVGAENWPLYPNFASLTWWCSVLYT